MRKVQPYRFVPQTSYSVEQFGRWSRGSGFPPPEPLFFQLVTPAKAGSRESHMCHDGVRVQPCVYILASHRNGTLYIGITSDLDRRASDHGRDLYGEIQ